MSFRLPSSDGATPESPVALFDELNRAADGPESLWLHQGDLLRAYTRDHLGSPDVALELPTGAGKTLVGMLVGEFRRRHDNLRVVYLSANRQLARQVIAQASAYGISCSNLLGSAQRWDASNESLYRQSRQIGVTTYASIFNSNPKIDDADLLILDDAHSGHEYIAENWRLSFSRSQDLYWSLLERLAPALDPLISNRLREESPDPRRRRSVFLVPPRALSAIAGVIESALSALDVKSDTSNFFSFQNLSGHLAGCFWYVSWDEIAAQPFISPTFSHAAFERPQQRLYMSATLGDGGELERAFGRTHIEALPIPEGWDRRGTGRRFFVFPELVSDMNELDETRFVKSIVAQHQKAVWICPSNARQLEVHQLLEDSVRTYGKELIEESLDPFIDVESGVLVLANRYDGIDLPDDACRVVVIDSLPMGSGLQDRFLLRELGASRVLEERMKTRLVQGAGRCARNRQDYSLVLILGNDLVQFMSRREIQESIHPEMQVEIQFGLDNSLDVPAREVQGNVRIFMGQEPAWSRDIEPALSALRSEATRRPTRGADALSESVSFEVRAFRDVWDGNWKRAVERSREVLARLQGGSELRPYRSLWHYLCASWAGIEADTSGDEAYRQIASAELEVAKRASGGMSWINWQQAGPRSDESGITALERAMLEGLLGLGPDISVGGRIERTRNRLFEGLNSGKAGPYEVALSELGRLLGADAYKPELEGRADSVWAFQDQLWIVLEAKNTQSRAAEISLETIRQANTHLAGVAADRDEEIPPGSLTVLVTPREYVDPRFAPLARDHVRIATLDQVQDVANEVLHAWASCRPFFGAELSESQLAERVCERFREHRVIGDLLVSRFTPIAAD